MYFKPYPIERAFLKKNCICQAWAFGGRGFNFVMCEQVRCPSNINMGMHIGKTIFKTSIGQALTNR
jgi:hypothetical protein